MNAFGLMGRTEGGHMKGLRNFLRSYSANEGLGESRGRGGGDGTRMDTLNSKLKRIEQTLPLPSAEMTM